MIVRETCWRNEQWIGNDGGHTRVDILKQAAHFILDFITMALGRPLLPHSTQVDLDSAIFSVLVWYTGYSQVLSKYPFSVILILRGGRMVKHSQPPSTGLSQPQDSARRITTLSIC